MHFGKVRFSPFVVCHLLSSLISPFTSTSPLPSTLLSFSSLRLAPLFLHFSFSFFLYFLFFAPLFNRSFRWSFVRSLLKINFLGPLDVRFVGRSRVPHSLKLVFISVVWSKFLYHREFRSTSQITWSCQLFNVFEVGTLQLLLTPK